MMKLADHLSVGFHPTKTKEGQYNCVLSCSDAALEAGA